MSYTHLTNVASFDSLLTDIAAILAAEGWTINNNLSGPIVDSSPTSGGHELIATSGDCLVGLRSTTSGPGANILYLCDGVPPYAGTPDACNLPNNSGLSYGTSANNAGVMRAQDPGFRTLQQQAGPFPTCDVFTDAVTTGSPFAPKPSTYCHIVLQVTTGVYAHLCFGNLQKFGTWTGGGYYTSTYWTLTTNQISVPNGSSSLGAFDNAGASNKDWTVHYENGASKWIAATETTVGAVARKEGRSPGRGGFNRAWYNIPQTPFSGLVPLSPIILFAKRNTDTPHTLRPIGRVPNMRMLNIQTLQPATEYVIGVDNWFVFPLRAKKDPNINDSATANSGYYGFAYKVIN